jgi:hypothetical protein
MRCLDPRIVDESAKSVQPDIEHRGMSILKLRKKITGFHLGFIQNYECNNLYCRRRSGANVYSLTDKCNCGLGSTVILKDTHSRTCNPMQKLVAKLKASVSSVSGMDLGAHGQIPVIGSKWGVGIL